MGSALWRRQPRIWPSACRRALRWPRALSWRRPLRMVPRGAPRCLSQRRSRLAARASLAWRPPGSSATSCSLNSSVFGVDEPVDLYAKLVAGVYQRVEKILPRGPLAMQQVRFGFPAVVAHDIGYELRHGAAEGRPVGRYLVGEVDGAHLRQQIGRPRARDPHQLPPVRGVEDADEPLVSHRFCTTYDRHARSWCTK